MSYLNELILNIFQYIVALLSLCVDFCVHTNKHKESHSNKTDYTENVTFAPVAAFLTGGASVHHTCMRLGLSPLKEQLYKFGIVDSATCEYCFIEHESCVHYFLKCPSFSINRCKLLSNICQFVPFNVLCKLKKDQELVAFFLKGSDQLSKADNLTLF